jgi:hypothetical protein
MQAAVGARHSLVAEQGLGARVSSRVTVGQAFWARRKPQNSCHSRWSEHENIVVRSDPSGFLR